MTLSCVCAAGVVIPIQTHVYAAINSGDCTLDEVDEFGLHVATQLGWPKGQNINMYLIDADRQGRRRPGPGAGIAERGALGGPRRRRGGCPPASRARAQADVSPVVKQTAGARAEEYLVLTAERLFAEHGIGGVSLRKISSAAGNGNNSAVQYHFGSKETLIQAIFEFRLAELHERRERLVEQRQPNDVRAGSSASSSR